MAPAKKAPKTGTFGGFIFERGENIYYNLNRIYYNRQCIKVRLCNAQYPERIPIRRVYYNTYDF